MKRVLSRLPLAPLLTLALVGLTLVLVTCGAVWWLAPSVAAQADELRRSLPESLRQAESWLALTINNEG